MTDKISTVEPIKVKPVNTGSTNNSQVDAAPNKTGTMRNMFALLTMVRFLRLLHVNDKVFDSVPDNDITKKVAGVFRKLPVVRNSELVRKSISAKVALAMLQKPDEKDQVKESIQYMKENKSLFSDDDIKMMSESLAESDHLDGLDPFVIEMQEWHKERNQQKGITKNA